jgi:chitinase
MEVDGMKGCLGSLMALKRQKPHLKVLLSIGGGAASKNFVSVAANAALRDAFGRSARELVNASGLDGIDSKFYDEWHCADQSEPGILGVTATNRYIPS